MFRVEDENYMIPTYIPIGDDEDEDWVCEDEDEEYDWYDVIDEV